jgi:hypothetical protein
VRQAGEGGHHGGKRELEQDCAQGAAEDDQSGGRLQKLADVAAFEQQPGDNAEDG